MMWSEILAVLEGPLAVFCAAEVLVAETDDVSLRSINIIRQAIVAILKIGVDLGLTPFPLCPFFDMVWASWLQVVAK